MLLEDLEECIWSDTEYDFIRLCRKILVRFSAGPVHIKDTLENSDLILRHRLLGVSSDLFPPSANIINRADCCTGTRFVLFGAEFHVMPREMETLPAICSTAPDDGAESKIGTASRSFLSLLL